MNRPPSWDVGDGSKSAKINCSPLIFKDQFIVDAVVISLPETEAQGLDIKEELPKASLDEEARSGMNDPKHFVIAIKVFMTYGISIVENQPQ